MTDIGLALFVPDQRWGWEYRDPGSVTRSGLRDHPPVLRLPEPPSLWDLHQRIADAKSALPKKLFGLFVLLVVLAAIGDGQGAVIPLVLLPLVIAPLLLAQRQLAGRQRKAEVATHDARATHERQVQQWQAAIQAEEDADRQRRARQDVWFPLRIDSAVDRIDVFGGMSEGWPHLLATFGATVLADRSCVTVLDFSTFDVAAGLMDIARQQNLADGGSEVVGLRLPRDAKHLDLFAHLTAEDTSEVLTEAIQTLRGHTDTALRALDRQLLKTVLDRLVTTCTPARLSAGLRVLQRVNDQDEALLSLEEVTELIRAVDTVGSGEQVQNELRFLRSAIDLLDTPAAADDEAVPLLSAPSRLTVVSTWDSNPSRKDFMDRVLFQTVLQRLRTEGLPGDARTLVVAAADHLGPSSLEALAKQCVRRGVRLVYLFEHLRDGTRALLGSGHSATIIMKLGNADEAALASEYIGRGYRMVLSQISRQVGITHTNGGGTTTGFTSTATMGQTRNAGPGGGGSGSSYSTAVGHSYQEAVNWAEAVAENDGEVVQRVYELEVETSTIQTLPPTAFVLVQGVGQRRAVIADCNPAIALLERVAPDKQLASA